MKADRITRVNELIRRELGVQLYRVVNRPDFDTAAVTFTHALTSVDLRSCRVLVSIRGELAEQGRMLTVLKRHRADFQAADLGHEVEVVLALHSGEGLQDLRGRPVCREHPDLHDRIVLRYTPHIHFVLDHSVEQGDQVLQLLNRMEETGAAAAADETPAGEEDPADPRAPQN